MFPSECFFPTWSFSSYMECNRPGIAWIWKTQTAQISQLAQSPTLTPFVLFCYTVLLTHYKISDIGFKSVSPFRYWIRVLQNSSAFTFCRGCFTFIATCEILNKAIIHLILYFLTHTEISFPEIYVYWFLGVFVNRSRWFFRAGEINSKHTRWSQGIIP